MTGRKLKVFQAQFGFYDTVVAAASRAAALRAWGIHQNLFASGEATVTADEAAVAAAIAHPGTPLRRAVGSQDPFALEPTGLPKILDAPKNAAAKQGAKSKPVGPRRARADRSKLDGAEKALRELDERRKLEEADFRREREAMEARREAAQRAYVDARKAATAKVANARSAYRGDGGEE